MTLSQPWLHSHSFTSVFYFFICTVILLYFAPNTPYRWTFCSTSSASAHHHADGSYFRAGLSSTALLHPLPLKLWIAASAFKCAARSLWASWVPGSRWFLIERSLWVGDFGRAGDCVICSWLVILFGMRVMLYEMCELGQKIPIKSRIIKLIDG